MTRLWRMCARHRIAPAALVLSAVAYVVIAQGSDAHHRCSHRGACDTTNRETTLPPEPAGMPAPLPDSSSGPYSPSVDNSAGPYGLIADDFDGPDGLITDHEAYWSDDPEASHDPKWAVEGGAWRRWQGTAWTATSIFRAWSKRDDLQSVRVEFDLRTQRFTDGVADRAPEKWDGVKVWLHARHTNGGDLGDTPMPGAPAGYTAEVNLRDGQIYVQKKVPGYWEGGNYSAGGTYFLLDTPTYYPARLGAWERVGGVARNNPDGSVTVQVLRDGVVVHEVTDRGAVGGPPLTGPGRIGIRGDNTEFQVDRVRVTAVEK